MSLTHDDLKKLSPIGSGSIVDEIHFNGYILLQTSNKIFRRLDHHLLRGSNRVYRLYNKFGNSYMYFPESDYYTHIQEVQCVISDTVSFDGFALGKRFELRNGQVWEQTEPLNSNCSPGGKAIIYDNKIKVGNWNFYPMVRRIK